MDGARGLYGIGFGGESLKERGGWKLGIDGRIILKCACTIGTGGGLL